VKIERGASLGALPRSKVDARERAPSYGALSSSALPRGGGGTTQTQRGAKQSVNSSGEIQLA
jgi:hypothetical protein